MPPTLFLSYRRRDAGYAEALYAALAGRLGGDHVFKDVDSMALGTSWKQQVTRAIDRSTHVIALIGEGWMDGVDEEGRDSSGEADSIVFELVEAFARDVHVVPVLLGGRVMPRDDELPIVLREHGLPTLNAARIRSDSPGADIGSLVQRFAGDQRAPDRTVRRRAARRAPALGLLAVATLLAVVVAVWWTAGDRDAGERPTATRPAEQAEDNLAHPSEDGLPVCGEPSAPGWTSLPLPDDPTGEVFTQDGPVRFDVREAWSRPHDDGTWDVVLHTSMTNDTTGPLQHGSWYYRELQVARREFKVACISTVDDPFAQAGLVVDARVGFRVRCEPVGTVRLVIQQESEDTILLTDDSTAGAGC